MDDMAKYLVLIYGDEQRWADWTPEEGRSNSERHDAFQAAVGAAMLGGHALQPSATATSLRAGSGGQPTITDGPFLETKEAIGGYYPLEAADLDEAIAMAARVSRGPAASTWA